MWIHIESWRWPGRALQFATSHPGYPYCQFFGSFEAFQPIHLKDMEFGRPGPSSGKRDTAGAVQVAGAGLGRPPAELLIRTLARDTVFNRRNSPGVWDGFGDCLGLLHNTADCRAGP